MSRHLLQLVLNDPAIPLASWPLTELISSLGYSGQHTGTTHFVGYSTVACLFVGTLIGWGVARLQPDLAPAGRWIWLPSTAPDGRAPYIRPTRALIPLPPEIWFATGGNEGLAAALVTLPAFAAVGYSLGALSAGARLLRIAFRTPAAALNTLGIAIVWLLLIGISLHLAYTFEASAIWESRVNANPTAIVAGQFDN